LGTNIFFPSVTGNNQLNIGNILFGTLPATTTGFQLPTSGTLGIGTSTPGGKFAIALNNGDASSNNFAFLIASSTANSTSTLFSVANTGLVTGITSSFTNSTSPSLGPTSALFTNATTTSLAITNLATQAGQCLTISSTGDVKAQSCASGNFAYPFTTAR